MNKRVLMVSTVPSMIGQFNINNINILLNMGYLVDVAADFTDTSVWPIEKINNFKKDMKDLGVECIQLNFSRNPLKFSRHLTSYKEILQLLQNRNYSFIHTHTPIASAIIRMACKKTGTKVIYTAHGFHFYNGAPLKNWIIFYPIEKWLSKYTDILITINQEDYKRALNRFKAKKIIYVPGVGIDLNKFSPKIIEREEIRNKLGIPSNCILLLSIGELSCRKNHEVIIKALNEINNNLLYYVIVGKGILKDKYSNIDKTGRLILLGYRTDIDILLNIADIFVFPSLQEGLPVSLMEAMAVGLPCIASKIRGNTDLINDGDNNALVDPKSIENIKTKIQEMIKNFNNCKNQRNINTIKKFDIKNISLIMKSVYSEIDN